MQAETNLVRCLKCYNVYPYAAVVRAPRDDFGPCPNCGDTGTLLTLYTTSDSRARVFFNRVTEPAVEVEIENRNRDVDHYLDQELRSFKVAAFAHIYKGTLVGRIPHGYAQLLVAGDPFMGLAYEEMDNTGGSDGGVSVRVYTVGDFGLSLVGADMEDIGKPVFACSHWTLGLRSKGNTYVGCVQDLASPGEIILRLDTSAVGCRVFADTSPTLIPAPAAK